MMNFYKFYIFFDLLNRKSFSVTEFKERQAFLKMSSGFDCHCEACTKKYPVQLKQKDRNFVPPTRELVDSVDSSYNEFIKSNEYVQKYDNVHFPCYEIDVLTERNVFNIGCIASDWMKFQV